MSAALEHIRSYLKQVSGMMTGMSFPSHLIPMQELVVKYEVPFASPGEPLTPEEILLVEDLAAQWGGEFETKECFYNAQRLVAVSDGQLRYFEGFAMRIIPVHHAWAVTESGKVVDLTWRLMKSEYNPHTGDLPAGYEDRAALGTMAPATAYLGVELPEARGALRRMQTRGWCESYRDDWHGGYEALNRSRWEAA